MIQSLNWSLKDTFFSNMFFVPKSSSAIFHQQVIHKTGKFAFTSHAWMCFPPTTSWMMEWGRSYRSLWNVIIYKTSIIVFELDKTMLLVRFRPGNHQAPTIVLTNFKKHHETISSLSLRTAPFVGGFLCNVDMISLSGGLPRLKREVPASGKEDCSFAIASHFQIWKCKKSQFSQDL